LQGLRLYSPMFIVSNHTFYKASIISKRLIESEYLRPKKIVANDPINSRIATLRNSTNPILLLNVNNQINLTMRKLILSMQMSADGFVADSNGRTDWQLWKWDTEWNWDDELKKYFTGIIDSVDSILLSRKMAKEGFISHWKQAAENPNDPRFVFAGKINETHKVVFTKTLEKSEWDNTDLAKGVLTKEINRLKSKEGKDIIVYGGAGFVSALIKEELIDEFQFFINPTAIGNGMTIFSQPGRQNMTLVNAKSYDCGIVVLIYNRKNNQTLVNGKATRLGTNKVG